VSQGLQSHLEQICEDYLSDDRNHQLAIGIIDGEDFYHYYLPNPNHPNELALSDSSVFEIGGVSKVYTALITLELIKEGSLAAEDSIGRYLPDSVNAANSQLADLCIIDLATHHAGLPRQMGGTVDLNDPYGEYDRQMMFAKLMKLRLLSKKRFMYSHFGYGILSEILEIASGKTYRQLLQQYVLKDRLKQTYADDCPGELLAPSFRFDGTSCDYWNFPVMVGTEGIESSLPDLLEFSRLFLNAEAESTASKALEIQEESRRKGVFISWGWHVFRKGKKSADIFTHAGRTGGFSSYVAFIPEKNVSIVVLANSRNAVDLIGIDLLEFISR